MTASHRVLEYGHGVNSRCLSLLNSRSFILCCLIVAFRMYKVENASALVTSVHACPPTCIMAVQGTVDAVPAHTRHNTEASPRVGTLGSRLLSLPPSAPPLRPPLGSAARRLRECPACPCPASTQ